MTPDPNARATVEQAKLATYDRYVEAQKAVDTLSDEGFPVRNTTIVWSRLRQIEYVTGRRTIATAARDGALTGLWFGAFLGILLSLFVELDDGASPLGLIITYALAGAVINAIFTAFRHWSQRGQRDFSTTGKLDAEAFEVWVERANLATAAGILGIAVPTDDA